MNKINVAILCGGPSSEREVSIRSAQEVAKNLDIRKYDIDIIEIDSQGRFFLKSKQIKILDSVRSKSVLKNFDVLFLALHGRYGEDGQIQTQLDLVGVPYTFSKVSASTLGMNKLKTNQLAKKNSLKLPDTITLKTDFDSKSIIKKIVYRLGFPCVVKPNQSGSSVGITIVKNKKDLLPAIKLALGEDKIVLVQEFIDGRELTCGVLGNSADSEVEALPVLEIIPAREFFDYEAKYLDENTQEICPADILENLARKVKKQAVKIHQALGCDGLSRSDFIYNKEKGLYFLEINTIPGLTAQSLCPKEAQAAGYTYTEFLDKIIQLALKKKDG